MLYLDDFGLVAGKDTELVSVDDNKKTADVKLNTGETYKTLTEFEDGDKDGLVPVENLEFIRKGISENGNTQVKTIVFPGLNHMFQPAVTGSPVEYSDIEETIAPAVLQYLVNRMNQL